MSSVRQERLVLDFVDDGVASADEGVLPNALDELSVRLDLMGAGPVLDEWCRRRVRLARRRRFWARVWRGTSR